VHHVDGKGEWCPEPNHDTDNLVALCTRCHRLVHTERVRLTPELLSAADERRAQPHVNLPHAATISDYLMQPDRAIGLMEPD
jgi:hypothetical protein